MSDSYRKAMDRIVLSDDVKERITKNVIKAKNNRPCKNTAWTKAVGAAACFAIAVFSVFTVTDILQISEKTPVEVTRHEDDNIPKEHLQKNNASGKKVTDDSAEYEIKNMASFSELEAAVGYEIKKPGFVPDGYEECSWTLISENTAEILYIGAGDILTYRTSKADSLTDNGVYEISEKVTVYETQITLSGNSGKYLSASWIRNGEGFLVTSICGLEKDSLIEIVKSTM